MRPNTVRQKWREGKPAIGAWLSIPSSYSAEIMANQGFDWLCIDTQHGAIDYNTAFPMLQAISTTPTMPFVRVPWSEPSIIMKYLDAGAYGIIVPMISSRQQAEDCVAATRYPPKGIRSSGPNRVVLYAGGDYLEHSDDEVVLAVMIETPQALDNLDDILSVPGIDAAYIGPSDLSQALGLGPRYNADNPKHAEAVNKVLDACKRHNVIPGIHTSGNVLSSRYARDGFKMIMLTTDGTGVIANAKSELAAVGKTLEELAAAPAR